MTIKLAVPRLLLVAALICMGSPAFAGKKVVVGQSVAANQQVSTDRVDHSTWHELLQKYVNKQGQVNYRAWQASAGDRRALENYLKTLSSASSTAESTKQSKLAFWINAYNAVTVEGILREYPTSSIRKHTSKLGGYNIWHDLLLKVGNTQISLNDIEHAVLRKMGEPRMHFAIVCASHSCPRLLNQAYTADKLEEQLVANTKIFFANPENFQYDSNKGRFEMSAILDWFAEDFGNDQAAQLKTIAPYLPTRSAQAAAVNNSVRISHFGYDWTLNEQ